MAESFKVLSKIRSEEHLEHITILMAVYRPNRSWLKEQLESLEKQSYADISLCIADDCPEEPVGEAFFEENLRRIPFVYEVHLQNIGTSQTYAALAKKVTNGYIAFCDQDDRWYPEKLEKLAMLLENSLVQAAYCGLCVIDGNGISKAQDVRKIRKGDAFLEGDSIAAQLVIKNSIYGCSLLIRAATVQEALPLPKSMTFDHWFSLWAALKGGIRFFQAPLVEYRIHTSNQSLPFRGINSKTDYEKMRIDCLQKQAEECIIRFASYRDETRSCPVVIKEREILEWTEARRGWLHRHWKCFRTFCKYRRLSPRAFAFELALPFVPEKLVFTLLHSNGWKIRSCKVGGVK